MLSSIKESWKEIRYKVEWINYEKLQKYSKAVLLCSFFLSILVGIMDLVVKFLINQIYY